VVREGRDRAGWAGCRARSSWALAVAAIAPVGLGAGGGGASRIRRHDLDARSSAAELDAGCDRAG